MNPVIKPTVDALASYFISEYATSPNSTAVTLLLPSVVIPDDLVKGSVGPSLPHPFPLLIIKPMYLPMLFL